MTTCKLSEIISPAFVEPHRAVKANEVNEVVEKGGRGSAKSSHISVEVVLLLLKNPMVHVCVFRKYGNTLRSSVYAQICWAIAQLGLTRKFRCTVGWNRVLVGCLLTEMPAPTHGFYRSKG